MLGLLFEFRSTKRRLLFFINNLCVNLSLDFQISNLNYAQNLHFNAL